LGHALLINSAGVVLNHLERLVASEGGNLVRRTSSFGKQCGRQLAQAMHVETARQNSLLLRIVHRAREI